MCREERSSGSGSSKKAPELLDGEARVPDDSAERAGLELLVVGDCDGDASRIGRVTQPDVAPLLTNRDIADVLQGRHGLSPGDDRQAAHAATVTSVTIGAPACGTCSPE